MSFSIAYKKVYGNGYEVEGQFTLPARDDCAPLTDDQKKISSRKKSLAQAKQRLRQRAFSFNWVNPHAVTFTFANQEITSFTAKDRASKYIKKYYPDVMFILVAGRNVMSGGWHVHALVDCFVDLSAWAELEDCHSGALYCEEVRSVPAYVGYMAANLDDFRRSVKGEHAFGSNIPKRDFLSKKVDTAFDDGYVHEYEKSSKFYFQGASGGYGRQIVPIDVDAWFEAQRIRRKDAEAARVFTTLHSVMPSILTDDDYFRHTVSLETGYLTYEVDALSNIDPMHFDEKVDDRYDEEADIFDNDNWDIILCSARFEDEVEEQIVPISMQADVFDLDAYFIISDDVETGLKPLRRKRCGKSVPKSRIYKYNIYYSPRGRKFEPVSAGLIRAKGLWRYGHSRPLARARPP